MKEKKFVGKFGIFASLTVTMMGVGLFTSPKSLASTVGKDGWIATIIAGILVFLLIYLNYLIIKMNNYDNFNTIIENTFGKIIGKVILLLFIGYLIIYVSISIRSFSEVITLYMLEETPIEFIVAIFILCGVYLIRGDLRSLINFNIIAFWIMFVPILFSFIFVLEEGDLSNLLPLFQNKPINYLEAIKGLVFSFGGFEIIYLILPYAKEKNKIPKALRNGVIFTTFVYCITTMFTIILFCKAQTKVLLWPTITMLRSIDIPGTFVERWEGIVMMFWIMFYFTTFVNLFYFLNYLMKNLFNLEDVKLTTVVPSAIIYILALYPESIAETKYNEEMIYPIIAAFFLFALPLLTMIIGAIRRKGGRRRKRGGNK